MEIKKIEDSLIDLSTILEETEKIKIIERLETENKRDNIEKTKRIRN